MATIVCLEKEVGVSPDLENRRETSLRERKKLKEETHLNGQVSFEFIIGLKDVISKTVPRGYKVQIPYRDIHIVPRFEELVRAGEVMRVGFSGDRIDIGFPEKNWKGECNEYYKELADKLKIKIRENYLFVRKVYLNGAE